MRKGSRDKRLKKKDGNPEFRCYRLLIKIFGPETIEHRSLEIHTTGLRQLLEMRRVHSKTIDNAENKILEFCSANN